MKCFEDNVEEYISNLGRKGFLEHKKAVVMKKKISKFNYVKIAIVIFPSSKEITHLGEKRW